MSEYVEQVSLGELSPAAVAEDRLFWAWYALKRAREARDISAARLTGYRAGSMAWILANGELAERCDEAEYWAMRHDEALHEAAMYAHFEEEHAGCPF